MIDDRQQLSDLISVVYDAGVSPKLAWIRDEGNLSFSDTSGQSLWVETITVHSGASFKIGTEAFLLVPVVLAGIWIVSPV